MTAGRGYSSLAPGTPTKCSRSDSRLIQASTEFTDGRESLPRSGNFVTQEKYDDSEQEDILAIFNEMLAAATADGGRKREAGTKPHWVTDPGHKAALWRHFKRWTEGEIADPDSGAHPLVHVAWRALAISYQEGLHEQEEGCEPFDRDGTSGDC